MREQVVNTVKIAIVKCNVLRLVHFNDMESQKLWDSKVSIINSTLIDLLSMAFKE